MLLWGSVWHQSIVSSTHCLVQWGSCCPGLSHVLIDQQMWFAWLSIISFWQWQTEGKLSAYLFTMCLFIGARGREFGFEQHVVLDHLIREEMQSEVFRFRWWKWCSYTAQFESCRHFMELVVQGLSSNDHYSPQVLVQAALAGIDSISKRSLRLL